ncbi:MAG TPA: hypothetical protein VFJ30_09530 [Phycisphaerae bacterium]|nr:hypothetical protein [Phycisphaerae bacterium]
MATDLSSNIAGNAQGPAEACGDSESARQHGIRDLIAVHRYLAARDALADRTRKTFGVRVGQLVPPGAI